MSLIVFEDAGFRNLLPLVYSRATFNLRIGFDNLLAKIETAVNRTADAVFVRPVLAAVMAERQPRRVNQPSTCDDQLWVNGRVLLRAAFALPPMSAVWQGEVLVAARVNRALGSQLTPNVLLDPVALRQKLGGLAGATMSDEIWRLIDWPWQAVQENAGEIVRQAAQRQCDVLGRVYAGAHLVSGHAIHVGGGTTIKPGAVLDAEEGPIYIGENATVSPGAVIVGPCYIGDKCIINPGAAVRPGCSIGEACKIGGEVEGTIFHGYSNKQHDGFIGHSYVGEWVNLGADTVGSDLKNTYGPVRVPINGVPVESGQTFVGAFIGDHTKTAIGTRLPTGAVFGYGCNVLGSRMPPQFVPSFSWLTDAGAARNDPVKALDVALKVVARRGRKYSAAEQNLFMAIAEEAGRVERDSSFAR
ncbi:MAG: hypothetical protein HBSAPP02_22930 [Phycisphaerae bacterium]|nr:MAG: hypothetical protein HRU71_06430 [Planctomycetia bacterium]RIK67178.1 MAG: hypothetical protein DCC66_12240 [Planctomycetota bacterium]GJQ27261.1 MAG: hypothetical protein HBSAPP02_22930 [Phycisphaerae bacterium]